MESIRPGKRWSRSFIGAVFYGVLGTAPSRGTFVTGMVVAMSVSAVLVAVAAAATLLLPRRTAARPAAGQLHPAAGRVSQVPAAQPVTAGAVAGRAVADRAIAAPVREQVTASARPGADG